MGNPKSGMKMLVLAKPLGGANFPELQKYWVFVKPRNGYHIDGSQPIRIAFEKAQTLLFHLFSLTMVN